MENSNKRIHARAQFFFVRHEDKYVPVFAFRPADDPVAIAALVVDLSKSGVQVLSTSGTDLENARYELQLISGESGATRPIHTCEVHRIWSRQEGMYVRSGFAFAAEESAMPDLMSRLAASEHHLLRCVLHPLN
jgi:hypothetical protein